MSAPHPTHNEITNKSFNKELGCPHDKVIGVPDQHKPQIFYFSRLPEDRTITPYYISPRSEIDIVGKNGLLYAVQGGGQKWFLIQYQYYFAIVDYASKDGEKLAWTLESDDDGTQVCLRPLTFNDNQMWGIHEDTSLAPSSKPPRGKDTLEFSKADAFLPQPKVTPSPPQPRTMPSPPQPRGMPSPPKVMSSPPQPKGMPRGGPNPSARRR